jgi:hypothetical protein
MAKYATKTHHRALVSADSTRSAEHSVDDGHIERL